MVRFGLDVLLEKHSSQFRGKRVGVLCHAASITCAYSHIVDVLAAHPDFALGAIFGPQHGLFGQTQDNMVEWEGGFVHPRHGVPVHSLYGAERKPSPSMLAGLDALLVDLQDVGARPYTYIWTVKLCLEACSEAGVPVWVLDRPNPIGAVAVDGPMLSEDFHSFVGGAPVPLCHRMTMAEMACMLRDLYYPHAEIHVVDMDGWWRDSLWPETGLPWILPSPNMPTFDTAVVYPGMVLLEATNLSEGRGTTRPFELFGAPYLNTGGFRRELYAAQLSGCTFREHDFQPTFQKWAGQYCHGMQVHVTAHRTYRPVRTTVAVLSAALRVSPDSFAFKQPPYEYESTKMPFDILSGDAALRECLASLGDPGALIGKWDAAAESHQRWLAENGRYPEARP